MSNSKFEAFIGAVVVAAAVTFVIFTGSTTQSFNNARGSYPIEASFRSLEGVALGTDVRLAGVKIGTVSDIALDPQTYRARTVLSVQSGIDIPDDSAAVIASEGLLGGTFVEIVPGASSDILPAGGELEDTQSAVSLTSLLLKFVSGGGQ